MKICCQKGIPKGRFISVLVPSKFLSAVQEETEKCLISPSTYNIPMDFLWKTSESKVFTRAYIICTTKFYHLLSFHSSSQIGALVITKLLSLSQVILLLSPELPPSPPKHHLLLANPSSNIRSQLLNVTSLGHLYHNLLSIHVRQHLPSLLF